jgi:hypothetical protein
MLFKHYIQKIPELVLYFDFLALKTMFFGRLAELFRYDIHIDFVSLEKIDLYHSITNPCSKQRVTSRVKDLCKLFKTNNHLSMVEYETIMPSSKPIRVVKHNDRSLAIQGQSRIYALKSVFSCTNFETNTDFVESDMYIEIETSVVHPWILAKLLQIRNEHFYRCKS